MIPRMINPGRVLADDSDDSLSPPPPPPSIPTPPPLPFSTSSGEFSISSSHSLHSSSSSIGTDFSSTLTSTSTSNAANPSNSITGHSSNSHSTPVTGSILTTPAPSSGLSSPSNGSNGSDASSSHHGKLSAGIIGMIVALSIFGLILILFFTRMWYMRRRKAQRANANWTWDGKPNPSMTEKAIPNARSQGAPTLSVYSQESEGSRWSYRESEAPGTARTNHRSSWFDSLYGSYDREHGEPAPPLPALAYARPSLSLDVPSTTDANPAPTGSTQYLTPASDLSTPVFSVPKVTEAGVPYILATVQRPFIRKLPDELPTTTGQQLGVIRQFDDGWTLCVALNGNTTGPQGMVPTECLKRMSMGTSTVDTPIVGPSSSFNNAAYVNRKSSLLM